MNRPKRKTVAEMTDEEIFDALANFINLPPVNRLVVLHGKRFVLVKFI